jgi:hypothetical protein
MGVTTDYAAVKRWRSKSRKNREYGNAFMRQQRSKYRKLYLQGKIAYADIPPAYRYFKDTRA